MTVLELIKVIEKTVKYNGGSVFSGEYYINFYRNGEQIGLCMEKDHLCNFGNRTVERWQVDMPNINIHIYD